MASAEFRIFLITIMILIESFPRRRHCHLRGRMFRRALRVNSIAYRLHHSQRNSAADVP